MTIGNGNTATASDVLAMMATAMQAVQDDNEQVPAGLLLRQEFHNVVAGTSAERRKWVFVVPFDCYLEALSVEAGDHTAASTTTVALTADGAFYNWPVTISGTTGAGRTLLSRLLYDNTKSKQRKVSTVSRALRALPAGTTVTVTVTTTSVATPSRVGVSLILREFFAR